MFVLNFTNGTTSPALSFNAQDWFGTTANVAIQAIGRLKLTGTFGPEDNGPINPNMYQTTIDLVAIGQDKPIASITFTKPAGAGAQQTTGIFAISGTVAYREPVITQQPTPRQPLPLRRNNQHLRPSSPMPHSPFSINGKRTVRIFPTRPTPHSKSLACKPMTPAATRSS
ncbi:MAG: hypothetical protein QM813_02980 [Verrucomicrobiota bacterium]